MDPKLTPPLGLTAPGSSRSGIRTAAYLMAPFQSQTRTRPPNSHSSIHCTKISMHWPSGRRLLAQKSRARSESPPEPESRYCILHPNPCRIPRLTPAGPNPDEPKSTSIAAVPECLEDARRSSVIGATKCNNGHDGVFCIRQCDHRVNSPVTGVSRSRLRMSPSCYSTLTVRSRAPKSLGSQWLWDDETICHVHKAFYGHPLRVGPVATNILVNRNARSVASANALYPHTASQKPPIVPISQLPGRSRTSS